MSEGTNPELGALIRRAFDHAKRKRNLTSDADLARALGIHAVTFWRWTQGDIGQAAEIMLPLVADAVQSETCETPITA